MAAAVTVAHSIVIFEANKNKFTAEIFEFLKIQLDSTFRCVHTINCFHLKSDAHHGTQFNPLFDDACMIATELVICLNR